jgi:hypothetical protein
MTNPLPIAILMCFICHQPVTVETSKTDEHGNSVHEDCYVSRIALKDPPAKSFKKIQEKG